jgi:hypothetical protein
VEALVICDRLAHDIRPGFREGVGDDVAVRSLDCCAAGQYGIFEPTDRSPFMGPPARPAGAREAEGAEREELWRLVNNNYSGYEVYQRLAGARRIAVMVLTPR